MQFVKDKYHDRLLARIESKYGDKFAELSSEDLERASAHIDMIVQSQLQAIMTPIQSDTLRIVVKNSFDILKGTFGDDVQDYLEIVIKDNILEFYTDIVNMARVE